MHICIYIYIYGEREREGERDSSRPNEEGSLVWEGWVVFVPLFKVLQFDIQAKFR